LGGWTGGMVMGGALGGWTGGMDMVGGRGGGGRTQLPPTPLGTSSVKQTWGMAE
jgi:hypothetical protein